MISGMDNLNSAIDEPTELKPCVTCGRTFRPETLERHYKICQKSKEKKRRVFDSKKQRAVEGEQPSGSNSQAAVTSQPIPPKQRLKKKPKQSKPSTNDSSTRTASKPPANNDPTTQATSNNQKKENSKPKSNWREKHEELIRTIRRSRGEEDENNNDTKNSKPYVPSDYVQCPGCQRNFNQRAAERHIPWCQQKQSKTPKSPAVDEAKEKLFARVKYRVPPPGKVKKIAKAKTAEYPPAKQETVQQIDREKEAYSSPPSLPENRTVTSNGNAHKTNKREPKSGSRTSESKYIPSPTESFSHIIKFKERFPNHTNKRGLDLEESFTAEQLQELLRGSRLIDSRCPKTVPGVRLTGSNNRNNWTSGLNKSMDDYALPEVSSSEDTWLAKYGWGKDLEASTSSSGSSSSGSLPPMSRESPSEAHLLCYCHQCHHKFPFMGAKYCCECGARRRGIGTVSQTV